MTWRAKRAAGSARGGGELARLAWPLVIPMARAPDHPFERVTRSKNRALFHPVLWAR